MRLQEGGEKRERETWRMMEEREGHVMVMAVTEPSRTTLSSFSALFSSFQLRIASLVQSYPLKIPACAITQSKWQTASDVRIPSDTSTRVTLQPFVVVGPSAVCLVHAET